jgi:hypothetical protein
MRIVTAFAVVFLMLGQRATAAQNTVRAAVECQAAGRGYFPFSAGRDRCWEPINGKVINPKTVLACAVLRSDGVLSVTFRYSEQEKVECDSGKVATRDQVEKALPLLGKREREFYRAHAK